MPGKFVRKLRRFLSGHPSIRDLIDIILITGVLFFGFKGGMILVLQTNSPLRGVTSNSMKPTFQRGDLLIIKGIGSPSDIRENDIIVFEYPSLDKSIVHRVVRIRLIDGELRFIAHGDARPSDEIQIVPPEDVIGKVVYHLPYLGYPSIIFD